MTEPWASRGCKSWEASYNSVGRDYVQHAAPAQPQSGPPALWDPDESFLTDPAPARGTLPATLRRSADADEARRRRRERS